MGSYRCDSRRRPSINLDAGYVSITSVNICQASKTLGLHGKKLICVICTIIILFLISSINLACLLWVMYKLDWSLFDSNGSKIFRYDKINHQIEFYKQATLKEPIYTTKINNIDELNFLTDKHIDIYGDQNSILFDDDQILFNTDNFYLKNNSFIDFTNFYLFKFDDEKKSRIHLDQFYSQHIHNKRLNLSAINRLRISNINHGFFSSQNLIIEANRQNYRSIIRFKNYSKRRKISLGNLHLKSDSIFFDLPRLPLLGNNYRSESNSYRICICNTTFLFLRSFAHQPCPLC